MAMTRSATVDVRRCIRIRVHGVVQGVGFRPFVYRLAHGLGLTGDVRNAGGHVVIRVAGPTVSVADFLAHLAETAPTSARVDRIEAESMAVETVLGPGFSVVGSIADARVTPQVPPDLAICAACLRELFDPTDRRYRYPFLNCTDCGPRATVIDGLPYDRERTAMRAFELCPACSREYHDPADRRFHAEPTSCPDCGPRLAWHADNEIFSAAGEDALQAASAVVAGGGIVAMKGIGGYQLVCDAGDDAVVARLRETKPRPTKPLAVMVADIAAARELGSVDAIAAELLGSAAAPIVLLPRRADAQVSAAVAPGSAEIGVFLPYSPLHQLLLSELKRPLVVTSGNRGGAPIIIDDAAALTTLRPIVDGILTHDRPIRTRYDDSVVRVVACRISSVRRGRGYAPTRIPLPTYAAAPILAVGAQLKHTSTLAVGEMAIVGPHTGDLENPDAYTAFEQAADTLCLLHNARPKVVAHDLHPGYLSTRYARRWPTESRIAVQHHHAHVAATAAEHGVTGPFVGIALDGLGLGEDGTFWGGEILVADLCGYRRFGRFGTAPMPGGAAAVRRPARMALGYLFGAERFDDHTEPVAAGGLLDRMDAREVAVIRGMIEQELNCPRASSAGRLFDAVAALLGICDDNNYEGEAAVRLQAAAVGRTGAAPLRWALHQRDGLLVYDPTPTLRDVVALAADEPVGEVAARFHRTVATVMVTMAAAAAAVSGTDVVCLGGGVFQNARLTTAVLDGLAATGLNGLVGEQIPMNDGGISYGQAAIAAARMSRS
ncbi:carbamoyltransferase HypF [Nocardia anaemiae]|uniref:carbamoyltransferase HypF n=1 Tax=Nocardia anaemiae TaxID=263910 RepID=UPI0007A4EC2A|nr:carbamoyltransferase HypF [Nocardia anaemiae]